MALSLLLLALGAGAQSNFTPDTYFDMTVPSTWAQVRYNTTPNYLGSWVTSYPSSQSDPSADQLMWPVLSAPGNRNATFQFSYPMTGFKIYGSFSNWSNADSFTLQIDGQEVPSLTATAGLLCGSPELNWGDHLVFARLSGGHATINIDNITISTGSRGGAHGDGERTVYSLAQTDMAVNKTHLGYEGDWKVYSYLNTSNTTTTSSGTAPKYPIAVGEPGSVLRLNVPKGTSFVQVNGTLGSGNLFQAVFDPLPPTLNQSDLSYAGVETTRQIPTVLFTAPLDPGVAYNASIQIADKNTSGTAPMGISSVAFWSAAHDQGPGKQKGSNVGAIVGGVVGGVGGALLLALVGWLFYRLGKRRSRKQYAQHADVDLGDDGFVRDTDTVSPFKMDREEAQSVTPGAGPAAGGATLAGGAGGAAVRGRVGSGAGRRVSDRPPVLPPLVTETKLALNADPGLTLNPPLRPDVVLSPGVVTDPHEGHTRPSPHDITTSDLTPLERETKAALQFQALTPATGSSAQLERETKAALQPSLPTRATGSSGARLVPAGTGWQAPGAVGGWQPAAPVGGGGQWNAGGGGGQWNAGAGEGGGWNAGAGGGGWDAGGRGWDPRTTLRPLQIPGRRVAQEEDGGRLNDDLELVPPSYNPEWARERQVLSPMSPDTATSFGHSPMSASAEGSAHPSINSDQPLR